MENSSLKKFAIFGNPVEHSLSPNMQQAGFRFIDFDATYQKHKLEDGKKIKKAFLEEKYLGANITVPHKEIAYNLADEVRGIAKKIGAVNTYINENGKIIAYNTDAIGFMKAIQDFGKIENALIIGAGGTAKAIAIALLENGVNVTVLNRSEDKLTFFKDLGCKVASWKNFVLDAYDLVINSTSAGLKDDNYPFDKSRLENIFMNANFAFDCIYGKLTPFLALAKKEGLKIKDGEDMLLYQGVEAFELFTNTTSSPELVQAMRKGLRGE